MLVGRTEETRVLDALIAGGRSGESRALVVRGEAGIGKTALLEYACTRAEGMLVLTCTGVETESELAFAGLHQLLRPVLGRIDDLEDAQAAALRGALALSTDRVDDRFRVAVAVLALLAEVANEGPILCVVDDAQWVDSASSEALLFAARRLQDEPVTLLFGARDDDVRPFLAPGVSELRVPPLGREEAEQLAKDLAPAATTGSGLDRVVSTAQGNPLVLIELASHGLADDGDLPRTSVDAHYQRRLALLPESARRLLTLAAADDVGDRPTIARAAELLGSSLTELEPAEAAGFVHVTSDAVSFRHPLMRSAAYRGSSFVERERSHRALADALEEAGEPDRRAWHRAAAAAGPDEDVAAELERTAERARARGGHGAASTALRRAADLSTTTAEQGRRLMLAAMAAHLGGDARRAAALADTADPLVEDGATRAQLALVRGESELLHGLPARASDLLTEAAEATAATDPAMAVELAAASVAAAATCGDPTRVARAHAVAPQLEPAATTERLSLLRAALDGCYEVFHSGDRGRVPRVDLLRLQDTLILREKMWIAATAMVLGDWDTSRAFYAIGVEEARAEAPGIVPHALGMCSVIDVLDGHIDQAAARAQEAVQLARDLGSDYLTPRPLAVLAAVAAAQGREQEAQALIREVWEPATRRALALPAALVGWAEAMLALARGNWEAALEGLDSLRDIRLGFGHPQVAVLAAPSLVEAAVRTNRPDIAEDALTRFSSWAEQTGTAYAQARVERCRALLATAADEALEAYERALQRHPPDDGPFEVARTQLLYGEILRRARRRAESRVQLRAALQTFERLAMTPWADRAAGELRATGESARRRDPSTLGDLTPQELNIARLVGSGASNKDVAAKLFLSPRTVEYHLRKVFQKLGITSRAELIRHQAADEALVAG